MFDRRGKWPNDSGLFGLQIVQPTAKMTHESGLFDVQNVRCTVKMTYSYDSTCCSNCSTDGETNARYSDLFDPQNARSRELALGFSCCRQLCLLFRCRRPLLRFSRNRRPLRLYLRKFFAHDQNWKYSPGRGERVCRDIVQVTCRAIALFVLPWP